jgi:hypothetical protein
MLLLLILGFDGLLSFEKRFQLLTATSHQPRPNDTPEHLEGSWLLF